MMDLEIVKDLSVIAYTFLRQFDPKKYNDGYIELNNGHYANINTYETQYRCGRRFEAHKKYIDIQYMIEGEELITVAPVSDLKTAEEYNEKSDIEFYNNDSNGVDYSLRTGEFLIFKPGEGHMPCIILNGRKTVRKAVIKVPVEL